MAPSRISDQFRSSGSAILGVGRAMTARRQLDERMESADLFADSTLIGDTFTNQAAQLKENLNDERLFNLQNEYDSQMEIQRERVAALTDPTMRKRAELELDNQRERFRLSTNLLADKAAVDRYRTTTDRTADKIAQSTLQNPMLLGNVFKSISDLTARNSESFTIGGGEAFAFSQEEIQALDKTYKSQAAFTSITELVRGNRFDDADQLLDQHEEEILDAGGGKLYNQLRNLVVNGRSRFASRSRKVNNYELATVRAAIKKAVDQDGESLSDAMNDPVVAAMVANGNLSTEFLQTSIESAEAADRLVSEMQLQSTQGGTYSPTKKERAILDARFSGQAQRIYYQEIGNGGPGSAIGQVINAARAEYPSGYLPESEADFIIDTMTADLPWDDMTDSERYLLTEKAISLLTSDPYVNNRRAEDPSRRKRFLKLQLLQNGRTPEEVNGIIENMDRAAPNTVEKQMELFGKYPLDLKNSQIIESASKQAPFQLFGSNWGPYENIMGFESLDLGVDIDIPLEMRIDIDRESEQLISQGLPAPEAFRIATNSVIREGRGGWHMYVETEQAKMLKNSPTTVYGIPENTVNGVLTNELFKLGLIGDGIAFTIGEAVDSRLLKLSVLREQMSDFGIRPTSIKGKIVYQIVNDNPESENYMLPVTGEFGEGIYIDYSPYVEDKSYKEAVRNHPEMTWEAEWRESDYDDYVRAKEALEGQGELLEKMRTEEPRQDVPFGPSGDPGWAKIFRHRKIYQEWQELMDGERFAD